MHGFEYLKYHKGAVKVGQTFYPLGAKINAALSTLAQAIDKLIAFPFLIEEYVEVDKLELDVTGAGGAGNRVAFGIYSNTGPGVLHPEDLMVASIEGDGTATGLNAVTTLTGNSILKLSPGVYWLAYTNGNGTVATVRALASTALPCHLGWTEAAPAVARTGIQVDRAFVPAGVGVQATLPVTFPDPGTVPIYITTAVPMVLARPSA
jgi:hypothetical protein